MIGGALRNRFRYHPPKGDQAVRYGRIRGDALLFAEVIDDTVPDSPEKDIAMRKLEESVMWANAAIARNE